MADGSGRSGRTRTLGVLVFVALLTAACTGDLVDGHGRRGAAPTSSGGDFPSDSSSAQPGGSAPSSVPSRPTPADTITFILTGTGGPYTVTVTVDGRKETYQVRLPWKRMYDGSAKDYTLRSTIRNGEVYCKVVRGDGTVLITGQAGASGGGKAGLDCGAHR